MILTKIILENFRPFYGRQELDISTDSEKNFTIIHAKNGLGKTTLLNVISWCLYKKTSKKFEYSDRILNDQARSEGIYTARVDIHFKNDDNDFVVSRTIDAQKNTHDFNAYRVENGNYESLPSPDVFVRSLVPEEMSGYFFFDGEYAETFSGHDSEHGNSKEIKKALEKMLGCETAMQAIDDLKAVKNDVDARLEQLTQGDSTAEAYQQEINRLKEQLNRIESDTLRLDRELELEEKKKYEIKEQLRGTEGAEATQKRKDGLENQQSQLHSRRNATKAALTEWINKSSIGLFAKRAIDEYSKVEQDGKLKGYIPSKISTGLVEQILKDKSCICGRSFDEHSYEEKEIQSLLEESGNEVMNDRLMGIKECIGRFNHAHEESWNEFERMDAELKEIAQEIDDCERQIRECSEELKRSNVNEIKDRQDALEKCERNIPEIKGKQLALSREKQDCEEKIKAAEGKRDLHQSRDERSRGIQAQKELLSRTIEYLSAELQNYREESRDIITQKINDILKTSARKNYRAEIDESFNLVLFRDDSSTPVPKSGGMNQLLSLAFLASLVNFAADRREEEHHLLKPGSMAPLMLDSPFGQLDSEYRKSAAEFLTTCRQVILLATETQNDPNVLRAIESRIGCQYVLISENKAPNVDNKPPDIVEINSKEFTCSIYDGEKNRTKIEKVM